jgi:hypothetical protein
MTTADANARKRLPNPLSKEDRARDAASAMRDYQAAQKAELDKTARLREQRLAREAALAAAPAPAKPAKRTKKNSAK